MADEAPVPDGSHAASSGRPAGDGGDPLLTEPSAALPPAPAGHPPFDPATGDISRCPFFRALSGAIGAFARNASQKPDQPGDSG